VSGAVANKDFAPNGLAGGVAGFVVADVDLFGSETLQVAFQQVCGRFLGADAGAVEG